MSSFLWASTVRSASPLAALMVEGWLPSRFAEALFPLELLATLNVDSIASRKNALVVSHIFLRSKMSISERQAGGCFHSAS